jgi:hypothetical protein
MNAPITPPPIVPPAEKMRRALRLFAIALAAAMLLMQAPYAQAQHAPAPSGPTEKEKAKVRDKRAYEKDTEEAYKSTLKHIPDAKQNVDPWGNLRMPAPK